MARRTAPAPGRPAMLAALAIALPALLLAGPFRALAALALLIGAVALVRRGPVRRVGGHTGDTLGAAALLGEVGVLIGLATL